MPQSSGIWARAGVVGMLKLASKFAMDIFPSVIATILGAYIVNHYINTKPPAGSPATAAALSTADPKSMVDPKKAASKADSKSAERSADLGNMPEPGVRAKGISEKSIIDKSSADKSVIEKPAEKADKPSETASIPPTAPADTRRHQPAPREKAASKAPPAAEKAAEPVVAAPVTAPAADPAAIPDANDLARAAIERLRGTEPAPRVQESARVPEPPKAADKATEPARVMATPTAPAPASVPVAAAPSLQPLPPPIMVSTPPLDTKPAAVRVDDPLRPTPPADIPDAQAPLDLRADATDRPAKRPSVADDVLSATKKLFNSVLPNKQQ
jgi:hypothetical protein